MDIRNDSGLESYPLFVCRTFMNSFIMRVFSSNNAEKNNFIRLIRSSILCIWPISTSRVKYLSTK